MHPLARRDASPSAVVNGGASKNDPHSLRALVDVGHSLRLCIRGSTHYEHDDVLRSSTKQGTVLQ